MFVIIDDAYKMINIIGISYEFIIKLFLGRLLMSLAEGPPLRGESALGQLIESLGNYFIQVGRQLITIKLAKLHIYKKKKFFFFGNNFNVWITTGKPNTNLFFFYLFFFN